MGSETAASSTGWSRKIETVFLSYEMPCNKDLKRNLKTYFRNLFFDNEASKCHLTFACILCVDVVRPIETYNQICVKLMLRRTRFIQSLKNCIALQIHIHSTFLVYFDPFGLNLQSGSQKLSLGYFFIVNWRFYFTA